MHRHLVTIKVGIESRTRQRMQLYCLTLYQFRLKRLNTQTVQSWSTVQQYRMSFHYQLQYIPNHGIFSINDFFCRFYSFYNTSFYQFPNYKWFVQFHCHSFRKSAFVHFQFRSHNNNRTCRIIDTFTKQILTETSLFSFQRIRQRFQRSIGFGFHCTCLARVVKQRIDSFLQHTFFVT